MDVVLVKNKNKKYVNIPFLSLYNLIICNTRRKRRIFSKVKLKYFCFAKRGDKR